jgi:hypothetical protein
LGIGTVIVVVVATLALLGVLPAAVDAVVVYNRFYLGSDRTGDLPTAFTHIAVALLPLGIATPLLTLRRPDRADGAAAAWILVAVVFLGTQGRLWGHYVIPLAIPLAILARGATQRRFATPVIAFATVLAVMASFAIATGEAPSHRGRIGSEIGRWVQAHTRPNETILVWGVDASIYVAADRAQAGRFLYDLPLVTHGYATPALIKAWVAQLAAAPPSFIVDSEAANDYWAEDADFLRPPPPGAGGGRDLDLLDPLRDFVRKNYVFVIEIDGRKIYEHLAR